MSKYMSMDFLRKPIPTESMNKMTQQEIELAELDIEIAHLEALLELRNEQRRELVNYLGLNKERTSER